MYSLPKISVITPAFNASKTLKECIESVANQNYPNLEHWIIDGLSTDNTMEIVEKHAQIYPHIKYVSEKDKGIYDAMNKGIDLSSGEWLYFMGADDMLANDIFNEIFSVTDINDISLMYGKVRLGETTELFGKVFEIEDLNAYIPIPHQAAVFRKQLFEKYGYYDLKYKVSADADFFLKIFGDKNIKNIFFDEIFAIFGCGGYGSQQIDVAYREDYPQLVRERFQFEINKKIYLKGMANYYFQYLIYKGDLWKGLKNITSIMLATKDFGYYTKNTLYWLKERLKQRFKNSSK